MENSGYPFPTEKYESLAKEFGKHFEFLYRELSEDKVAIMQERGKSWGEADLIDYAMCNSKLIAETDVIYKCTGRVFLNNSKNIIKKAHTESEFIKWTTCDWCTTVFFKIVKDDYFKYMQSVLNEVDDYKVVGNHWYESKCIEYCYFIRIKNSNIKVRIFRFYPDLKGLSASSNKVYNKKRLSRFVYNVLSYSMRRRWRIK